MWNNFLRLSKTFYCHCKKLWSKTSTFNRRRWIHQLVWIYYCIHLFSGFGMMQPSGHVDYYPNSGRHQPGCDKDPFSFVKINGIEGGKKLSRNFHEKFFFSFKNIIVLAVQVRKNAVLQLVRMTTFRCWIIWFFSRLIIFFS